MIVADSGLDAGLPWHYGDPFREQRELVAGRGRVDLSNRGVLTVTGPDRLTWLHSLTSQHLEALPARTSTATFVLDPHGHIEHALAGYDDGETFWAHTAADTLPALVDWLDRMRFMMRVEVADRTADLALVWGADMPPDVPVVRRGPDTFGGWEALVPRERLDAVLGDVRAGTWAYEALRIAAGVPRIGVDTDARTIPNEIAVPDGDRLGIATHLQKGCYRGQETVAKVQNLGRPPRRLVRLQLDGTAEALPAAGTPVVHDGREVGFVGSSARHYEEGPIAFALVKRGVPVDAEVLVDDIAAAQDVLVDPDVGLHIRPKLR
ncbi:YgfZ/GcvT domain-containing protein [Propionicicella superfundia]|uniref:CAF17-like 4Fe-4S cluster assembly/insertion protein YgfZ n=1 Tax=Propionicicella superfundia TaxID=348582 RepID=UPI0006840799|nr:glycine cleavage T C-terminal barrel domain-containing protein [Propionicicella superfundia]